MKQKDQLHLGLIDNCYAARRLSLKAHRELSKKYVHGRLLDIGCGNKPMEAFFKDNVTEHIGLDHEKTLHGLNDVDVVGTAYDTGQLADSYDTVLCTAVLEHLEEPGEAIAECNRVLKRGGIAIYTAPLFWPLHEEPRDFYRYTKHGLRYLFENNGFEILELKALSGFWVTAGTMFNYYLSGFTRGPLKYAVNMIIMANNMLYPLLDRLHKVEKFTWMYLVVAKKTSNKSK